MIVTFELDLVEINRRVTYLGQRSFRSNVIVAHTDTHDRPIVTDGHSSQWSVTTIDTATCRPKAYH